MKSIGKITGNYLYILAVLSLLSIPYSWLVQKTRWIEFSWIFLFWVGSYLKKRSNIARWVTVGFNVFCILSGLIILSIGLFKPEIHHSIFSGPLKFFAVEIRNPSLLLRLIFLSFSDLASAVLIVLLLSKQAKEEFTQQHPEVEAELPGETVRASEAACD